MRAERWTVESLDILELSIAVDVDTAQASQQAREGFVAGKGLRIATAEAKTSQVRQLLVGTAAAPTASGQPITDGPPIDGRTARGAARSALNPRLALDHQPFLGSVEAFRAEKIRSSLGYTDGCRGGPNGCP